jgi:hypothetical protein
MPKAKLVCHFQPKHEVAYGLKISARNPASGKVSTVVCHFFTTFGREKIVGGMRSRTNNVKYFTTFRADGYKRHLSTAHSAQWAEYGQIVTNEGKEQFFKNVPVAFVNTLDAHLEQLSIFLLRSQLILPSRSLLLTRVWELRLTGWGFGWWSKTDNLHPDDLCSVIGSVGKLFVGAADGISRINCERDDSNWATDELPPVLPHELCRIDMRQFVKLLQSQRDRLLTFFGDDGIENISKDFAEFLRAFREEPKFKEAVGGNSGNDMGFSEGWVQRMIGFRCCKSSVEGWRQRFPTLLQLSRTFP